ncbi:MAG: DUF1795 domain-containing protein [Chloroflexota bacterium]|nr:DUF1795 domain-containing protein [Chloroflexota bacterium]
MKRRVAYTVPGLMIVLLLAACGGSGTGLADKTATARTADANDAATVTAFAGGGRTPSAGTPSTSANQGTGTKAAGGKGGFAFATFPSGGSGGPAPTTRSAAGGTPAAGTPRGTVASAGSARTGTPAGLNGNSYTDPQGRFTLMVPQGWRVQQPGSTDIDFQAAPATASALRGAFQIAAEDVGTGITLDDYATGTMDSIKQTVTNYRDVQGGIQQMSVGGQPARRFDFTGQDGTTNLRAAIIVVKKGTTAYGFLIAAPPEDFDAVFAQAKQFIDTFAFTP